MGDDAVSVARVMATPHRTGTYLILDNDPDHPAMDGNFRSGRGLDPSLRASGSHQLDVAMLADVVNRIARDGAELRELLIVDLRQESHAFLDGLAVSWCADKDWSNVDQSPAWIRQDERCHVEKLAAGPETLVYAVRKDVDGNLQLAGSRQWPVARAETEDMVVARLPSRLRMTYVRLHVTDHCAPEDDAVRAFLSELGELPVTTWVHFHCHGGDGRTTTFLMMYDMLSLAKAISPGSLPPDLEYFRDRQLQLFHYDVQPHPTAKRWQAPMSMLRWQRLEAFRKYAYAGYRAGQPWPGFEA